MVLTCASSNSLHRPSSRPLGVAALAARAGPLEFLAQPQLQLAGRLLAEGHGDDLDRSSRAPGRDQRDDPLDQLGGLAGAGRRLDDQRGVEVVGDAPAIGGSASACGDSRHPPQRLEVGSGRSACGRCGAPRHGRRPPGSRSTRRRRRPSPGRAASMPCSIAAVDDLEHLEPAASRRIVERDRMRR